VIVRFSGSGRSFKALGAYLTHDAGKAETSERVAFTHTFNLANDDISSAIDEMLWTYRARDLLKEEAGVPLGGSKVDAPVKHVSLNWRPVDRPSQEEMISAAASFLKKMGWDEHQCVLVCHTDTKHRHVHLMINEIHPEHGRKLDDSFERKRAREWGKQYALEHGYSIDEGRRATGQRLKSEPRPAWLEIMEQSDKEADAERTRAPFDPSYVGRSQQRHVLERHEWAILRTAQRDARVGFFAGGKKAYRALGREIYAQVREEFRAEWGGYFAARREGFDREALADMRADILQRQKHVLEERRKDAMVELRAERDRDYRVLLDSQQEQRGLLIGRQELGLRSFDLLDQSYPTTAIPLERQEQPTLDEVLDRFGIRRGRQERDDREPAKDAGREGGPPLLEPMAGQSDQPPATRTTHDVAAGLALGLIGILGHLGESLVGGHSRPQPKKPEPTDPLERFGIQRGLSPPGDANERAARAERDSGDDWRDWRRRHGLSDERER
jgi:hypothetical protein